MNRIVFFSGGLSSFAVAHHLKETYKDDNIVLYFTDTKWEDEDLYRFILEVSNKLELPLLIHSLGIDPIQLMIKQKILFNSRMGNCSTYLKMKVASDYVKKGIVPKQENWINRHFLKSEKFLEDPILYFGISFDEFHRTKAIAYNWEPCQVEFPLCKLYFDYDELLKQYDIAKPRLYLKGFTHNNCKGRCVKAGRGHYRLLMNEDLETFNEINSIEHMLSKYVAAYHAVREWRDGDEYDKNIYLMAEHLLQENENEMNKWHDSKYVYQPNLSFTIDLDFKYPTFIKGISLKSIKSQSRNKVKLDLFNEEVGGCGCFVDYETEGVK